jgi:hypothetical protein
MTRNKKANELIHEGKYAAEVEIELHYSDESWSPTMSLAEAAKHGRVFELKPVVAE